MASICRLKHESVRESLRELERRNMLTKVERQGKSTVWMVNPVDKWGAQIVPAQDVAQLAAKPQELVLESYSADTRNQKTVLIRAFSGAFRNHFGSPYMHGGEKDVEAAGRLLAMGLSPDQVVEKAMQAWSLAIRNPKAWHCANSSKSMAVLACKWNEIVAEIAKPPTLPGSNGRARHNNDGEYAEDIKAPIIPIE